MPIAALAHTAFAVVMAAASPSAAAASGDAQPEGPAATSPAAAPSTGDDDGDDEITAEDAAADPFSVDLAVDLPIIGLTAAVAFGTEMIRDQLIWDGCHGCDTSHLGPLDRRVLDNYNEGAKITSDILLYGSVAVPAVVDFADVLIHRRTIGRWGRSYAKDFAVLAEVATVNFALTNVVKFAVLRPRPYTYGLDGSDRDPTEGDAQLSFYSGHTSTAFAMATAYSYLFQARHPTSKWRAPVWILSYGLASTTGVMRVVAGKHFWSDVIVGAVAGSAIGLAIPAIHRRRPSKRRFAGPMRVGLTADRFGSTVA
ncbi:MAG: phosphatase PAP2 family protein, partial [Myxococcales bacterium]|nr:phosphatase PAP2 family protein [Myxococcales bacterium]